MAKRVSGGAGGVELTDLAVERVAIDSIYADPANVNRHGERNLWEIRNSLRRFGQAEPLLVQAKTGRVIGGNGRLEVMRELGYTEVNVCKLDLSDLEATALAIALNKTGKSSEFDATALAETLRSLQSESFDLAAVGYTPEEVDDLIAGLGDEYLQARGLSGAGDDDLGGTDPADPAEEPLPGGAESLPEKEWNPAIRFELIFDSVEQQDRWFAFVKWLREQADFEAETIAGRLDKFLVAGGYGQEA